MSKIKEKLEKFLQGRYGADHLGKLLMAAGFILYAIGTALNNMPFISLSIAALFFWLYRMLSRKCQERREENRVYLTYVKLWKLRFEYRGSSRIFLCKRCGRYVKVPKGRGRLQITCRVCGNKLTKRT